MGTAGHRAMQQDEWHPTRARTRTMNSIFDLWTHPNSTGVPCNSMEEPVEATASPVCSSRCHWERGREKERWRERETLHTKRTSTRMPCAQLYKPSTHGPTTSPRRKTSEEWEREGKSCLGTVPGRCGVRDASHGHRSMTPCRDGYATPARRPRFSVARACVCMGVHECVQ